MLGLFGILADENVLDRAARRQAFSGMCCDVELLSLKSEVFHGKNYSFGITKRRRGTNIDLVLRDYGCDLLIGLCGYWRFRGESLYSWASENTDEIAKSLSHFGERAFERLEGCFLCVAYCKGKWFIFSDRFGSHILYYYDDKDLTVFAPQVGQIISSGLVERKKNLEAAKQILMSSFFVGDNTLVRDVFRFPYASVMEKEAIRGRSASFKRYWDMPRENGQRTELNERLIEEFEEVLEQAICGFGSLSDDVLVPLSGGLDSRTIACFVSKKARVRALTYNYADEAEIARQVCQKLQANWYYYSNKYIASESFSREFGKLVEEQRMHCVPNQYFFLPVFADFGKRNGANWVSYDGIYMDELFSALTPKDYRNYNFSKFKATYCYNADILSEYFELGKESWIEQAKRLFEEIMSAFVGKDDVARCQYMYFRGRLRRYVAESPSARETYFRVIRPGFDYRVIDFGFGLDADLRMGKLYLRSLRESFPKVMEVRFKDSYGNRKELVAEKLGRKYTYFRRRLSNLTSGALPYYTNQVNYFFFGKRRIKEYRDMFLDSNYIRELMSDRELERLFNRTMQKQYLLDLFQRVLFIQQFYRRYRF